MKQSISYLIIGMFAFSGGIFIAPYVFNQLEIDPFARALKAEDVQYQVQKDVAFALMNLDDIEKNLPEKTISRNCKIVRLALPVIDISVFKNRKQDVERLVKKATRTVTELQKKNACG